MLTPKNTNPALLAVLAAAVTLLSPTATRADDWPQWLGPQRDGVWRETGILEKFPASGPRIRWRTAIGAGYSGPAVAAGRVYLADRQLTPRSSSTNAALPRGFIPGTERILCLDEATGKILWVHEYDCPYDLSYAAGPRTTPVVDGDKVYTLGAMGNLTCLETSTGRPVWTLDFKQALKADAPMWGFASNPLIDGQKLICMGGREGNVAVAFDKNTGKEIWRALSAREPGYSSPVIYEAGGRRQLIIWHPEALNALHPETGEVFWSIPFKAKAGLTAPTPRKLGDLLLVTSFYNGSLCVRLGSDQPTATEVWRGKSSSENKTDGLHSIIPTPFLEDGYIYGVCSYGQLRCLKLATGERVWETFAATTGDKPVRWANAFLIKNGDRFFIPNEQGDLIIARLSPQGYQEISRAHLIDPVNRDPGREVVWSHPAFANRSVYARNDKEIVCASLAAPEAGQ